ncbi:unnamed protein product, partial [Iphiclides podalirius]
MTIIGVWDMRIGPERGCTKCVVRVISGRDPWCVVGTSDPVPTGSRALRSVGPEFVSSWRMPLLPYRA